MALSDRFKSFLKKESEPTSAKKKDDVPAPAPAPILEPELVSPAKTSPTLEDVAQTLSKEQLEAAAKQQGLEKELADGP